MLRIRAWVISGVSGLADLTGAGVLLGGTALNGTIFGIWSLFDSPCSFGLLCFSVSAELAQHRPL